MNVLESKLSTMKHGLMLAVNPVLLANIFLDPPSCKGLLLPVNQGVVRGRSGMMEIEIKATKICDSQKWQASDSRVKAHCYSSFNNE
jgi:hypothetical protein